jgi:hypothetical protein
MGICKCLKARFCCCCYNRHLTLPLIPSSTQQDLSVTQLMQQQVAEEERGAVGGVQSSLQAFFEMSSYIIGLIWSRPTEFPVLMGISFGALSVAVLSYFSFWRRQ